MLPYKKYLSREQDKHLPYTLTFSHLSHCQSSTISLCSKLKVSAPKTVKCFNFHYQIKQRKRINELQFVSPTTPLGSRRLTVLLKPVMFWQIHQLGLNQSFRMKIKISQNYMYLCVSNGMTLNWELFKFTDY